MDGWRPLVHSPALSARLVGRPLLCVSDIQGDLAALEAVLNAVRHVQLAGIVACGNHVVGGPNPFEVWTRLQSLGALLTCGPTDLAVSALDRLEPYTLDEDEMLRDDSQLGAFWRARRAVGDLVCRRLGELPSTVVASLDDLRGVMASYGSPSDFDGDFDGALEDDDNLADRVASVAEDVFVTGGGGAPFARRVERVRPLLTFDDMMDPEEREALEREALAEPVRQLLVANVGVVSGQTRTLSTVRGQSERRVAQAVLIGSGDDGEVHAWTSELAVGRARSRRVG